MCVVFAYVTFALYYVAIDLSCACCCTLSLLTTYWIKILFPVDQYLSVPDWSQYLIG